jgi:hypothetical protein
MSVLWRWCLSALAASLLVGCSGHDSYYFPYFMTGLDVWVYDNRTSKSLFGGRVEAIYFSREKALSECGARAFSIANANKLQDWGYVCCTVTPSSDCVTKVR